MRLWNIGLGIINIAIFFMASASAEKSETRGHIEPKICIDFSSHTETDLLFHRSRWKNGHCAEEYALGWYPNPPIEDLDVINSMPPDRRTALKILEDKRSELYTIVQQARQAVDTWAPKDEKGQYWLFDEDQVDYATDVISDALKQIKILNPQINALRKEEVNRKHRLSKKVMDAHHAAEEAMRAVESESAKDTPTSQRDKRLKQNLDRVFGP